MKKKTIFAIIGSASRDSANLHIVQHFGTASKAYFVVKTCNELSTLPHFDPELSADNPPREIVEFRTEIEKADGILICTPEYIFSIPSRLKNAIEWCLSTTVFSDKPCALITASTNGIKGHEQLQLIMNTVMAKFTNDTTVLIQGVKGKISSEGEIIDGATVNSLLKVSASFNDLIGTANINISDVERFQ